MAGAHTVFRSLTKNPFSRRTRVQFQMNAVPAHMLHLSTPAKTVYLTYRVRRPERLDRQHTLCPVTPRFGFTAEQFVTEERLNNKINGFHSFNGNLPLSETDSLCSRPSVFLLYRQTEIKAALAQLTEQVSGSNPSFNC